VFIELVMSSSAFISLQVNNWNQARATLVAARITVSG
jgi:hypothetical protein